MSDPERVDEPLTPSDLSTDQLRDLVNTGVTDADPPADSETSDDDEATDTATEDTDEEESTDADVEEVADDEPDEETDDEPDEDVADVVAMRAELEAERAERKHQETVAGRHAGKLGFLEKQAVEYQSRIAALESLAQGATDDTGYDERPARQQAAAPAAPAAASGQFAMKSALTMAAQEILSPALSRVADADGKTTPEFAAAVERRKSELEAIAASGDADKAYEASKQLYREIVSETDRDIARRKSDELVRRRTSQAGGQKRKKRAAASVSSRSRSSSSNEKRQPKSVKDLSTDELRDLVNSRAGID